MPSNLTDTSSFDTVTGPVGADIRNAASVRSALQTLANRTRFLWDRGTALADIAALKAVTSPADGLIRKVKSRGTYVFDIGSAVSEALPYIVSPNAGPGRWLHEDFASWWKTTRTIFVPPIQLGSVTNVVAGGDTEPGLVLNQLGVSAIVSFPVAHDGAKLASVDVLFIPTAGHSGLPAGKPQFELFSIDTAGTVESPAGGYVEFPVPGTLVAYEQLQTWNIPLPTPVVMARATKYFYARFGNEYGANAAIGLRIVGFKLNIVEIPDMRAP